MFTVEAPRRSPVGSNPTAGPSPTTLASIPSSVLPPTAPPPPRSDPDPDPDFSSDPDDPAACLPPAPSASPSSSLQQPPALTPALERLLSSPEALCAVSEPELGLELEQGVPQAGEPDAPSEPEVAVHADALRGGLSRAVPLPAPCKPRWLMSNQGACGQSTDSAAALALR